MTSMLSSPKTRQAISLLLIAFTFFFFPRLNAVDSIYRLPDWLYYGVSDLWFYGGLIVIVILLTAMESQTIWHLNNSKNHTLLFVGHFVLLFLWAIFSMAFLPPTLNEEAIERFIEEATPSTYIITILQIILIGPLREEIIFRGFVFASLKK